MLDEDEMPTKEEIEKLAALNEKKGSKLSKFSQSLKSAVSRKKKEKVEEKQTDVTKAATIRIKDADR